MRSNIKAISSIMRGLLITRGPLVSTTCYYSIQSCGAFAIDLGGDFGGLRGCVGQFGLILLFLYPVV